MRFGSSLCLWTLVLSSCATATKQMAPLEQDAWLPALATQHVGQGATIESNRNGSFSLCWNDSVNPSNNVHVLKFVIVRMSDHKVVEQGSVTMGSIGWKSDYEVEVSHKQGQVELDRGTNSTTRTIDLKKYLDVIGR
jgi:hypothetical protein